MHRRLANTAYCFTDFWLRRGLAHVWIPGVTWYQFEWLSLYYQFFFFFALFMAPNLRRIILLDSSGLSKFWPRIFCFFIWITAWYSTTFNKTFGCLWNSRTWDSQIYRGYMRIFIKTIIRKSRAGRRLSKLEWCLWLKDIGCRNFTSWNS